jgi:hypothetical protein
MSNLVMKNAIELLHEKNATCVILSDDKSYISYDRGVKPLLDIIDEKYNVKGGISADKVVGKAAAMLYILLEIKELHACVISDLALKTLSKSRINVTYDQKVPMIRNRTDTGFCPMEQATMEIDDPAEAFVVIKTTLETLRRSEK